MDPIRLIIDEIDLIGHVRPSGDRISDLLRRGAPLLVLPSGGSEWISMEPGDMQIVIPPPFSSPPEWRVRRQLSEVVARAGNYLVTGTAHLRPGEETDPYLLSARQFLPLTSASLTCGDEAAEAHETIIVNLKRLDELRVT